jgi:hypothetical protein
MSVQQINTYFRYSRGLYTPATATRSAIPEASMRSYPWATPSFDGGGCPAPYRSRVQDKDLKTWTTHFLDGREYREPLACQSLRVVTAEI